MSTINKQTPIITLFASLFPQQHVESETLPPLSSDKAAFLQLGHLGFYAFLRKEDDGKYDGWSVVRQAEYLTTSTHKWSSHNRVQRGQVMVETVGTVGLIGKRLMPPSLSF